MDGFGKIDSTSLHFLLFRFLLVVVVGAFCARAFFLVVS